jgi:hypothetical protein
MPCPHSGRRRNMLNPSRPLVIALAIAAVILVALGLNTDAGLIGWTLGALIGLYLAASGIARASRRSG